jgi:hypothetical protein
MPESNPHRLIRLIYRNPRKSVVTSNNYEIRKRAGLAGLLIESLADQLHRLAQVNRSARRAVTAFMREALAESGLAANHLTFGDQLQLLSRADPAAFRAIRAFTREKLEVHDAGNEEQAMFDRASRARPSPAGAPVSPTDC